MNDWDTATETSARIAAGRTTASQVVSDALVRITRANPALNAFTDVVSDRALARAAAIDTGRVTGPLAGVPFAVKNLFDIAGLPTRAGSRINRDHAPATTDATAVHRLEAAGAVLVGALNMGEYAYDFTGENVHDGPSRNPHDLDRMTGGSSGGTGGAVAGGLVPIALGSDTNGSIRVPASFCGVFGLKATYGRLSRAGTFPFVASLDHVGPLARSVADLSLAYAALRGPDPLDPVCVDPPDIAAGPDQALRIAVLGGWFQDGAAPEVLAGLQQAAAFLGAHRTVELPEAARARAAAYVITTVEGAALHLPRLRARPRDFDPDVRDRLIAGAMLPAPMYAQAQRFRRWFRGAVARVFADHDVLLAPTTPCTAPRIGQKTMMVGGIEMPVRPSLGLYTQPLSFIGLPVCAVPILCAVPIQGTGMPVSVQVIAAPWREQAALAVAARLEAGGIAVARRPA